MVVVFEFDVFESGILADLVSKIPNNFGTKFRHPGHSAFPKDTAADDREPI